MTTRDKKVQHKTCCERNVLNIAHRGARAFAPENTLSAFAKAREFGCDMVELDVRMTQDEEIVVYHDEHLCRCTDAEAKFPGRTSYPLADFTYSELLKLDAGSWHVEQLELPPAERQPFLQSLTAEEVTRYISAPDRKRYASGEIKIPHLADVLALAKNLNLMVNIELKSPCRNPQALAQGTLALIKSAGMAGRIIVSSFDHSYLKLCKEIDNAIPIAALTNPLMKAPVTYLRALQADACNLGCFWDFPSQSFDSKPGRKYLGGLARLKKSGIPVNVWTCNNIEEMHHLLAAGVSGIISDYPNRVAQAIQETLKIKK